MLNIAAAQQAIAERLRDLDPAARMEVIASASRAFLADEPQIPKDFPTRLRAYRLARGFDQDTLGRIAGVDRRVISMYEHAQGRPCRPVLVRLTDALGVDAATLCIDPNDLRVEDTGSFGSRKNLSLDTITHPLERKLPPREPRREWNPKTPRTIAIDQTVALAIVRGEITNREVCAATGMTHKGADKRIQASVKDKRIERVRNGVYVAAAGEYARVGLDPKKRGIADRSQTVTALAERFKDLREVERSRKERGE